MVAGRITTRILQVSLCVFATCACDTAPPNPLSAADKLRIAQRNSENGEADGQQSTNNMDPRSWTQRLNFLQESAAKTASEMTEIQRQLMQVFSIRDALCERHSELLNACMVHTPLSTQFWRTPGCKPAKNSWPNRNYSAELKGVTGKFILVLDNAIESNLLTPNSIQKLNWVARGNRNLRDLKLSDIGSFKLKSAGGVIEDLKAIKFTFKLDDDVLLTEQDFVESESTETSIILNHLQISKKLSSPECVVDDNNIQEIVQGAISSTLEPEPFVAPSVNPELKTEENVRNLEHWITDTQRQFEAKSDIYLSTAQDISRLRRDLRGELQLGCWGRDVIKSFEINIKGEHLPLSDWDRNSTSVPLGVIGNPTQTVVDFGGGLRFTNADEKTTPIFHENGKWTVDANTDLTIGDISNVVIQKGGYAYQTTKNCWSTWGGLGTACEWQNRESNRYRLDALSIKVNGQLVYQRDSLNVTFERSSLNWIEKELTSNPAYISLMRRRDCPLAATSTQRGVPQ